jgi:hypothetical protein
VAGQPHEWVRSARNERVRRSELRGPSTWRGVALQFVLILTAALFYFGVRGLTQGSEASAIAHGLDVLSFEQRLGIDAEDALQRATLRNHTTVTLANWVYMWGHWPVVATTLFVLYRRDHTRYLLLRNAMFLSGAVGLVIFATYPVAPPRLLPGSPFVDTVTNWSNSYRVLQPPALVNRYAAVPSLHVGWNLLVGIALWLSFRSIAARVVAVVGPVLMMVAVVATANHYVLDAVLGAAVSLAAMAGIASWDRIRGRRRRGLAGIPAPDDRGHHGEVVEDHAVHAERDELLDVRGRADTPDEQPLAT